MEINDDISKDPFEQSIDITNISSAVRKIDISAVVRSFAFTGSLTAIAISLFYLVTLYKWDFDSVTSIYLGFLSVLALPLYVSLFILNEFLTRRPLRKISKLISYTTVMLPTTLVLYLLYDFTQAQGLEELIKHVNDNLYFEGGITSMKVISLLLALLNVTFIFYLFLRQYYVEKSLAEPVCRRLLTGDQTGASIWARLAFILGAPSTYWTWKFARYPGFWLFAISRLCVYIGYWFLINLFPLDLTFIGVVRWVLFSGLPFLLGHSMFFLAKRISAKRLLTDEFKKPSKLRAILFLRSFEDDQFKFERTWRDPLGKWFDLWMFRRNLDEILIDEFAFYGPVVALGKPGETKIPFGADRYYAPHDDWHDTVKVSADSAKAIVLVAGHTPGIKWEYELIKKTSLHKTIVLFPPKTSLDRKWAVAQFLEQFPGTILTDNNDAVAIIFTSTGQQIINSNSHDSQAYLVALRIFMKRFWKTQKPISKWWWTSVLIPFAFFWALLNPTAPTSAEQTVVLFGSMQIQELDNKVIWPELISKYSKINNRAKLVEIQEILSKIKPDTDFEITILNSSDVFVVSLRGNKLVLSEGAIRVSQNSDQLAYLISHAIAHQRHSRERLAIGSSLSFPLQDIQKKQLTEVLSVYGLPSSNSASLAFSRRHELEANMSAIRNMNDGGYKVCESIYLLKSIFDNDNKFSFYKNQHGINEKQMEYLDKYISTKSGVKCS